MTNHRILFFLLLLPLTASGQTTAELYQAGLAAEKGEGDVAAAAKNYAAVVERYRQGAVGSDFARSDLAARAQARLERLHLHLGVVAPPPIQPAPSSRFGQGLELTGRHLQALHRSLSRRIVPREVAVPAAVAAPPPDRDADLDRLYRSLRQRLGLSGLGAYALDPLAATRSQVRLVFVAEPLDVCRIFLGLEGLPERLVQIRRQRPQPRTPTPTELYLTALFLEKETADVEQAVPVYQQILQNQDIPGRLQRLARLRLDRCRQRLVETGAS